MKQHSVERAFFPFFLTDLNIREDRNIAGDLNNQALAEKVLFMRGLYNLGKQLVFLPGRH